MNKQRKIFISIGLLLLAAALGFTVYNIADSTHARSSSKLIFDQITSAIPEDGKFVYADDSPSEDEDDSEKAMSTVIIDGMEYVGTIEIPAYEVSLPVHSEWSYSYLHSAPCLFSGSVYRDDLIICAHNYGGHFGSISKLQPKDQVVFTDADGLKHIYEVTDVEYIRPNDMPTLYSGDWDMTLFTCTVGGSMRVLVRCSRSTAGY